MLILLGKNLVDGGSSSVAANPGRLWKLWKIMSNQFIYIV